jgi:DNA-binding CsgD family transcriptional regulator
LIEAVINELNSQASRVLIGRARLHSPAPYDWLAAVLCCYPDVELPIPDDARAWLAQLPDVPVDRYAPAALLRLAVIAIRALAGDGPALIVADDLHALDPASLSLLAELAGTPDLPALLVVATRPSAQALSPDLASRTLARLTASPTALRLRLKPLSRTDVAAYIGAGRSGLAAAVHDRTGGNPYELAELVATGLPGGLTGEPDIVDLTARELEVLHCLTEGMSNKQVARHLDISVRTVAVHVSNLLRKTGSASRTEAALWAVRTLTASS